MPLPTRAFAASTARAPLAPFSFSRRDPGPRDVVIEIAYCGVCHSDIHQARAEWGEASFPMVPGHEIVGRVSKVGAQVKRFAVGDLAGVGCFVDSCRTCEPCRRGDEHYCDGHLSVTYNGTEQDEKTPTQGGYSERIVVDEAYTLKVPANLPLERVAPLLCAGITTYSPLKHWKVGPGQRLAVAGLGGLGHMAVKLGVAFGADVTVLSTSKKKEADARRLGAHDFKVLDAATVESLAGRFDVVLDTISAQHELKTYLGLLRLDGALILVGAPERPLEVPAFSLIPRRRTLAGSMIGGIRETQEMLDFCAARGIASDVEVIPIQKINEAYERTIKGDVRFRFVIDMKSLKA
jgi:alcohol dehydrogenase (NADP+)